MSNPDSEPTTEAVERRVHEVLDENDVEAAVHRADEKDPGSAIVDIAEREEFDLIVLGGGDSSPMGKITVGSIAEFVLLNARVSVKLVR